jgi:hypothetical protein
LAKLNPKKREKKFDLNLHPKNKIFQNFPNFFDEFFFNIKKIWENLTPQKRRKTN